MKKSHFDRWFDKNAGPDDAYTFGEVVWKAARAALRREQKARRKTEKDPIEVNK